MFPARAVAYLALHTGQPSRSLTYLKAGGVTKTRGMARNTIGIKMSLDISQGIEGPGMPGAFPGPVFSFMAISATLRPHVTILPVLL